MKCLLIHGSPRKGNTHRITGLVKEEMARLGGVAFDEVFLGSAGIGFCTGCNACFIRGEQHCPHASAIQDIVKKLEDADCLILTSPTYALQMSALVKNLFDHTAYFFHRPHFFDKQALVISTTAGAGAKSVASSIEDTLRSWGICTVHSLALAASSPDLQLNGRTVARIRKTAARFFLDTQNKKLRRVHFKHLAIYATFRALSETGKADAAADYRYWNQTGLADRTYARPLDPVRTAFAALVYRLAPALIKPKSS